MVMSLEGHLTEVENQRKEVLLMTTCVKLVDKESVKIDLSTEDALCQSK